jgi:hypothetical protein
VIEAGLFRITENDLRVALRRIAFDPLLFEAILPSDEGHGFIQEMRRYDRQGRGYWWGFMRGHGTQGFASPLQFHALEAIAPSCTVGGNSA